MQTVQEKIDAAVEAAMMALGLSSETMPDAADALREAITPVAENVVTSDFDDE